MPLHCAATRPKFLNVPSFSFPNPVTYVLTRDTWKSNITIFSDFLFSSVSSLALWCQLVEYTFLSSALAAPFRAGLLAWSSCRFHCQTSPWEWLGCLRRVILLALPCFDFWCFFDCQHRLIVVSCRLGRASLVPQCFELLFRVLTARLTTFWISFFSESWLRWQRVLHLANCRLNFTAGAVRNVP